MRAKRLTKNKTPSIVLLLLVSVFTASCQAQVDANNEQTRGVRDAGSINPVHGMSARRAAHTATLLQNGKVLIAGGFASAADNSLASAEIFDSATNIFSPAGDMRAARSGHSATLLPNGKVLIAGGYNGSYLTSAELYDPMARTFTPAGRMVMARSGQVAMLLRSGRVLLVGGTGVGWTFLAGAELYDPASNTFTTTGSMATARESHTTTLLADGKVLVTGGHRGRRPSVTIHSSAEIYDLVSGTFTAAANMTRVRHKHEAILLRDGRVLIVGGSDERDGRGAYTSAEIYDPTRGGFTAAGNMNSARYKLQGAAVLLNDGRVLIAGGANRAEIFDPKTNAFSYASGSFGTTRLFSTATSLQNGQVLIAGGYDDSNAVSSGAWIYRA
jgi:hypothetical protein